MLEIKSIFPQLIDDIDSRVKKMKIKNGEHKSMGTPASEYRKESSNYFELSLCVEFIFAKENLFELCIDYEKLI